MSEPSVFFYAAWLAAIAKLLSLAMQRRGKASKAWFFIGKIAPAIATSLLVADGIARSNMIEAACFAVITVAFAGLSLFAIVMHSRGYRGSVLDIRRLREYYSR